MAYVVIEDDTDSLEMLAFSNVLNEYGMYLKENQPVVIIGKLSLREDKPPQIIVNRAKLITDYQEEQAADESNKTLYLRLAREDDLIYPKVTAILNMFPGYSKVVLYFSESKYRRGTHAALDRRMIEELIRVLKNENVVLK